MTWGLVGFLSILPRGKCLKKEQGILQRLIISCYRRGTGVRAGLRRSALHCIVHANRAVRARRTHALYALFLVDIATRSK